MDIELTTAVDGENPVEGDIKLTNGVMSLVDGPAAIAQRVRVRLRWIRGEYFLDPTLGVPYFEEVFKKGVDLQRLNSMFRRIVEQTPGIASVERFAIAHNRATREVAIDFEARTTAGDVITAADFGAFVVRV